MAADASVVPQGTVATAAPLAAQGTVAAGAAPLVAQGTVAASSLSVQGTVAATPLQPAAPLSMQSTVAATSGGGGGVGGFLSAQGTIATMGTSAHSASVQEPDRASPDLVPPSRSCNAQDIDVFFARYSVGERLGEGSFATVKKCIDITSGQVHAAKIIDKRKAGVAQLDSVMSEVEIMDGLKHQHLIHMHQAFEGPQQVIIVMDFVAGQTLFDRIIDSKHYDEYIASVAAANLMEGIRYLHEQNIMHRDLKPENLLMKRRRVSNHGDKEYVLEMTEVVIADFGLAAHPPSRSICGSPAYVAPEILMTQSGDCDYGVSCDVWSLGVVIYVMFCGAFPFKDKTDAKTFQLILTQPLSFSQDAWADVSAEAREFLQRLLEKDPEERPSAAASLMLPWIKNRDRARRVHMEKTRVGLQRFRLREKVTTVMNVFRGARRLRMGIANRHGGAQDDVTPAFAKYVKATSDTSPLIPVQSQTDPGKVYEVDLRMCVPELGLRGGDFVLHRICSCASVKVCRHLQYVYQWLFLGDRHSDITPQFSELEHRRRVLTDRAATFPIDSSDAVEMRTQVDTYRTLSSVHEMLLYARDFKAAFEQVPETDKKAILGGLMSFRTAGGQSGSAELRGEDSVSSVTGTKVVASKPPADAPSKEGGGSREASASG
eukprot:TRINITY_DN2850_c3_g1_i1.p1 TRINITY_DN2850_c3_g1~~TRINITY_DN2850_c3_g1_i1.p1  ORF type:complete len:658 (+),score=182.96 TRINITY_DN2850_c3_g1_i1:178-2151(+)